jgi:phosphatidylserine synthase
MKERRPIRLSIPNAITLANLAVGYFAVMAAWNGQIGTAAVYILVCAVLDFLDGFAARLLKAYSELGKQLDSLADLVSFGVAPAAIAAVLLRNAAISRGWDNSGAVLLIIVAGSGMIPPVFPPCVWRVSISAHTTIRISEDYPFLPTPWPSRLWD